MLFVDIVLPVFLIVAAGYWAQKRFDLDFATLTNCSLYLLTPALIFSALSKSRVRLDLAADLLLFMLLYTALLCLLAWALGRICRYRGEQLRALALATTVMNCGNFGLPLVFFAYGNPSLDVSVLTFVVFNIPLSTLAIVLAQGSGTSLGKALLNAARIPLFHAALAALLLQLVGLEIPGFLLRPLELLGQAAIPLMLILLGMQLAKTRLQASLGFLSLATLIRLAVAPAVAWIIASLLGIGGLDRQVVVLQTSTPAAILPLLYSLRFGTRPDLVAGAILTTTVLSAVSLTVLLYLL